MTFHKKDLDPELLNEKLQEHYAMGLDRKNVNDGIPPEVYLIQNGWVDISEAYQDLLSPDGVRYEIKTINWPHCNDKVIFEDPNGYNLKRWTENYNKGKGYNKARYVKVFEKNGNVWTEYCDIDLETGKRIEN